MYAWGIILEASRAYRGINLYVLRYLLQTIEESITRHRGIFRYLSRNISRGIEAYLARPRGIYCVPASIRSVNISMIVPFLGNATICVECQNDVMFHKT